MKRKIPYQNTLQLLRELPLEVSFSQVEEWVKNYQPSPTQQHTWIPFFIIKWFSRSNN